jgi:hypothetical protein
MNNHCSSSPLSNSSIAAFPRLAWSLPQTTSDNNYSSTTATATTTATTTTTRLHDKREVALAILDKALDIVEESMAGVVD